jgi:hypothetical protein
VYREAAHRQVEEELREVIAYCCVCMRLGWSAFHLPAELRDTLTAPGPGWVDISPGALAFVARP